MNKTYIKKNQVGKVEELHSETQQWKSSLGFIKDEITFFGHVLNSYVFQPNTLNLFEHIQDYQQRLKKVEKNKLRILKLITKHESDLAGMLECTNESCDLGYYQKHNKLKADVVSCDLAFQELKSEIFNYAGGILKKRKPAK